MSALSELQREKLKHWAADTQPVSRAVLFGSRVKGTFRPESDLDIAIEIEPEEDSDSTLAKWMHFSSKWKAELEAILPYKVDLQWRDAFGTTETIDKAIREASEVIYEKASV